MTITEAGEQFATYLKRAGRSVNTIDTYERSITQLAFFLSEHYPRIKAITEMTAETLLDFQDYLVGVEDSRGRPLASKSIHLKLVAIRSFFSFLAKEDLIPADLSQRIMLPKSERRLAKSVLTEEEVKLTLETCDLRTPFGLRDRAILEVFYACGIRTSELCDLHVHDIDLREQTATIINGKGGKSRVVPIGQYASHFVSEYLKSARPFLAKLSAPNDTHLFLTQFGNPFDRRSINKHVIRPIERKLRLEKPLTCYTFRHSVATHLLKRGVDVSYIARLLGHESLTTTQQYLRIEIGDLKQVHAKYHPRENLRS